MAAPNLKSPTTITGKTARYAVTASIAAALSNASSSGKVLKINSILCANVDGTNAATLDLFVDGMGSGSTGVTTTGADATVYLAKTVSVPADSTLVVLDTPIYLMEGDVLKGGANAASDLDLFVSFDIMDDA